VKWRGIALVAVAGAACAPQPEQARHTVQAYRADDGLRKAQMDRCKNDPGTLGRTPDCVNAREAARIEDIGSFRDLPPLKPEG
jgi:hypothetical protein